LYERTSVWAVILVNDAAMNSGIDSETLCRAAGIELTTLVNWIAQDVIVAPETRRGQPRLWHLGEALTVALFAAVLREHRSIPEAASEARGMMAALDRFVQMAARQPDEVAGAAKIVFISAVLPDGERLNRMVMTDQDVKTVVNFALRKGAVSLTMRDLSATYCSVLQAIRVASRERELV
jgi:hypothetical protein